MLNILYVDILFQPCLTIGTPNTSFEHFSRLSQDN